MSFIDALLENMIENETPRLDAGGLAKIKAKNLPRATGESVGLEWKERPDSEPGLLEKTQAATDAYFSRYLSPCPCPHCGRRHGFKYGVQHGYGHCACGYPGVADHYPKFEDGEDVLSLNGLILWFHPDEIKLGK